MKILKLKKGLSLFLVLAFIIALMPLNMLASITNNLGLEDEFIIRSERGNQYKGKIMLTNYGTDIIKDWQIDCESADVIERIPYKNSSHYIVGDGWNASISLDDSIKFGINGSSGSIINKPSDSLLYYSSKAIDYEPQLLLTPQSHPVGYGDVNGDGVINATDSTMLRRYIEAINKVAFKWENPSFNEINADVNGDGKIDQNDVALLRHYLAATDPSKVSLGPPTTPTPTPTPTATPTPTPMAAQVERKVAAGNYYTMAIEGNGSLWGWGEDSSGQLGVGESWFSSAPKRVGTDTGWRIISAGGQHTAAIMTDGSLWTWGDNTYGNLGNGYTVDRNMPVRIGTDTWIAVSAGQQHTVGIKSDGSLWAWGNNGNGRLGDNSTNTRHVPTRIGTDTDWQSVSAGGAFTLALKKNGSLWAWGLNSSRQLGDGTTNQRTVPTRIGIDTDWKNISAGNEHSLAIKSNGSLWGWGANSYSQLGDGTQFTASTPTRIGTDSNWSIVSASEQHSMAIKSDGSMWGWGATLWGRIGVMQSHQQRTPLRVGTDSNWVSVSTGVLHGVGLKADGTIWTWGYNDDGQLGKGNRDTGTSIPILITIAISPTPTPTPGPSAPSISVSPSELTITQGQVANFYAYAGGNPTPTLQWQISTNGGNTWNNLVGETSSTLTVNNAVPSNPRHIYRCVATNSLGTATSNNAFLNVNSAPTPTPTPTSAPINRSDSVTLWTYSTYENSERNLPGASGRSIRVNYTDDLVGLIGSVNVYDSTGLIMSQGISQGNFNFPASVGETYRVDFYVYNNTTRVRTFSYSITSVS